MNICPQDTFLEINAINTYLVGGKQKKSPSHIISENAFASYTHNALQKWLYTLITVRIYCHFCIYDKKYRENILLLLQTVIPDNKRMLFQYWNNNVVPTFFTPANVVSILFWPMFLVKPKLNPKNRLLSGTNVVFPLDPIQFIWWMQDPGFRIRFF